MGKMRHLEDGVVGHEAQNSKVEEEGCGQYAPLRPPLIDVSRAKPDEGYAGKSPPDCESASWSLQGSLSLLRPVIHGYLRLSPCECPFDFGISKKAYGNFFGHRHAFFFLLFIRCDGAQRLCRLQRKQRSRSRVRLVLATPITPIISLDDFLHCSTRGTWYGARADPNQLVR